MRHRASTLGIAAVLAAAALLGACSSGNQAVTASTGTEEKGETASQAAASSAEGEKVLRFATHWEKPTFDPALWGDGGSCKAGISMYETLLKFDKDRNLIPSLAESWEVSDDKKTYTFHLRKGVQFHRGYGEFTSADVAYTLERLSDPEVGATDVKSKCKVCSGQSFL